MHFSSAERCLLSRDVSLGTLGDNNAITGLPAER